MQPAVTINCGHVSDVSNSIHTHDLWTYFKGKYGIKMLIYDITIYPGTNTIAQHTYAV